MGNCTGKEVDSTGQITTDVDNVTIDVDGNTSGHKNGALVGIVLTDSTIWELRSDAPGRPKIGHIIVRNMSTNRMNCMQSTQKTIKIDSECEIFIYDEDPFILPGGCIRAIMWCNACFWYGYRSLYDLQTFRMTPEFTSTIKGGYANSARLYNIPREGQLTIRITQRSRSKGTISVKRNPLEAVYLGQHGRDVLVRNTLPSSIGAMPDNFINEINLQESNASRYTVEARRVFELANTEPITSIMRSMDTVKHNVLNEQWDVMNKNLKAGSLVNGRMSISQHLDQTMECSDGQRSIILTRHLCL